MKIRFTPCPKPEPKEKKKVYVLKRTPIKKKAVKIKPLSDKRSIQNKAYLTLRKVYLENHPQCEYLFRGCTFTATEIDHSRGRKGEQLTNVKDFRATCRNCHIIRHDKNLKA